MTKLIIDCDSGSDDAIALFAAVTHPDLDLVAVTTVNGNVALEYTTENSLRALDHVGADVPVYQGAARPIVRPDFPIPRDILNEGSEFQQDLLDLPEAVSTVEQQNAVRFLIDTYLDDANADVTLVALGPLTNVALALAAEPTLAPRIPRLVLMGGAAFVNGNVSVAAEFNVWVDPEAAEAVLSAGIREVVIVPLDATHSAPLTNADCDAFDALGTNAGTATANLIRHRITHGQDGPAGSPVHDPMCVAYLVRPDLFTETVEAYVSVETTGSRTLGQLLVDTRPWRTESPNATVALRADHDVYRDFLHEAFR